MEADAVGLAGWITTGQQYVLHSVQALKNRYVDYVDKNPEMIAQMEKLLTTVSYVIEYLPQNYDNFVLVSELLSCANGLIRYCNDCIIKGGVAAQVPGGDTVHLVRLIERWLVILEALQAFLEMIAYRVGGSGTKWAVVVLITLVKAAMRLILLYVFKPNLQTHPYVKPLDRVKFLSKSEPGSPAERSHGTKPFVYVGRRTGIKMKRLSSATDGLAAAATEFPDREANFDPCFPSPSGSPTRLSSVERVGETLHILRPLIHLVGLGFFGSQSAVPWLASFVTDASSHTLLSGHVARRRKTSARFNAEELRELRRRAWIMAFYLLRSPVYDRFTKTKILKIIQFLCDHVPLARYALEPVARYLPAWQQVYFYVWSE